MCDVGVAAVSVGGRLFLGCAVSGAPHFGPQFCRFAAKSNASLCLFVVCRFAAVVAITMNAVGVNISEGTGHAFAFAEGASTLWRVIVVVALYHLCVARSFGRCHRLCLSEFRLGPLLAALRMRGGTAVSFRLRNGGTDAMRGPGGVRVSEWLL